MCSGLRSATCCVMRSVLAFFSGCFVYSGLPLRFRAFFVFNLFISAAKNSFDWFSFVVRKRRRAWGHFWVSLSKILNFFILLKAFVCKDALPRRRRATSPLTLARSLARTLARSLAQSLADDRSPTVAHPPTLTFSRPFWPFFLFSDFAFFGRLVFGEHIWRASEISIPREFRELE